MSKSVVSSKTQQYIEELVKRKTISKESLSDKMLLNHLCSLKIDEDYFYIRYTIDVERISA